MLKVHALSTYMLYLNLENNASVSQGVTHALPLFRIPEWIMKALPKGGAGVWAGGEDQGLSRGRGQMGTHCSQTPAHCSKILSLTIP